MSARKSRAVVKRKRRQHGGSFWTKLRNFGSKANNWLKRTKILSQGAKIASELGVPYAKEIGMAGKLAAMRGYGRKKRRVVRRRRRMRGKGLNPSGGSLGGALKLTGRGGHSKKKMVMPRYLGISY